MKYKYQVGDLVTTGSGKVLCIITEIKDNGAYYITSMETYSTFRYNEKHFESMFRKVS